MTTEIVSLADIIIGLHSFEYQTLDDQKKTAKTERLYYCFDAPSLCYYDHNLSPKEYRELGDLLSVKYIYDNEHEKERKERASLFYYLKNKEHHYHNYKIEKRTRPDFCLLGEDIIGVEVVRLTTDESMILASIAKENFGLHRKAEEIKTQAHFHHGAKADNYVYYDFDEFAAVGTQTINVSLVKSHFAGLIVRKYEKYKSVIKDFDRFVILADAQQSHSIELVTEDDVQDVIKAVEERMPDNNSVSTAVIWSDANNQVNITES